MKKIFLFIEHLIPSFLLGVYVPIRSLLSRKKIKVVSFSKASLIILCRSLDTGFLQQVISTKKPYIYEIDDNFFQIGDDNPSDMLSIYYRHPQNIYKLSLMIENAHLVRTYSKRVYEICKEFNDNTVQCKCCFNYELVSDIKKEKSDKIKIIYCGSISVGQTTNESIITALSYIADKYTTEVEIYLWGGNWITSQILILKNVFFLPSILNYDKYLANFKRHDFDIGIGFQEDSEFFNSKTNNKYREYAGCEVAGIYSNIELYSNCVQNKINGVLVDNNVASWQDGIELLVNDKKLRETIQKNALKDIIKNYKSSDFIDLWDQQILNSPLIKEYSNSTEVMNITRPYILTFFLDGVFDNKISDNFTSMFVGNNLILSYWLPQFNRFMRKRNKKRNFVLFLVNSDLITEYIFSTAQKLPDSRFLIFIMNADLPDDISLPENVKIVVCSDHHKIDKNILYMDTSKLRNKFVHYSKNPYIIFMKFLYAEPFFVTHSYLQLKKYSFIHMAPSLTPLNLYKRLKLLKIISKLSIMQTKARLFWYGFRPIKKK